MPEKQDFDKSYCVISLCKEDILNVFDKGEKNYEHNKKAVEELSDHVMERISNKLYDYFTDGDFFYGLCEVLSDSFSDRFKIKD